MTPLNLSRFLWISFLVSTGIAHADPHTDNQDWYSDFLTRVTEIQSSQPRWVTPVYTTTPRLEQEFRTDFSVQNSANGAAIYNYGNGKGLELIPMNAVEVILGIPPLIAQNDPTKNGIGDMPILLKYRILSANQKDGDYILTAFLQTLLPVGTGSNTLGVVALTPSLSFGKGYGDFDLQSTLGIQVPLLNGAKNGDTLSWSTAFQYHILPCYWPEVEVIVNHFAGGKYDTQTQAFLAPGILFGRFSIHDRMAFTVGLATQIPLTDFRRYDHLETLSMRIPF